MHTKYKIFVKITFMLLTLKINSIAQFSFHLGSTHLMFSHSPLNQINILQASRQMKERNNWLILTLLLVRSSLFI